MSTNADLGYVLESMVGLIRTTRPDQMTLSTPCDKWTVRDLINHFAAGGQMFAAAFRGESIDADGEAPDVLGNDPLGAVLSSGEAFAAALASPGAMERMIALPVGEVPAPIALQVATFDVLVHAWDLATATGQSLEPPTDLVDRCDAFARQILQHGARGDAFGPEVMPPPTASPLARLAAFTGRTV